MEVVLILFLTIVQVLVQEQNKKKKNYLNVQAPMLLFKNKVYTPLFPVRNWIVPLSQH